MSIATPPVRPDRATPGLLVLMSLAVVLLTAAIAATLVVAEWWLLPVTLLALVLSTAGIGAAVARTLGDGR
jgi:hypothetical protein